MKQYTEADKQRITEATGLWIKRYQSAKQASVALGVSSATLSNVLNGKWDKISDEMWTRIEAGVTAKSRGGSWNVAETTAYQEITYALNDARTNASMTWCVGEAGCGKTTTATWYTADNAATYYILCSEDMRRGDFLRALAREVGIQTNGLTLSELPAIITARLRALDNEPLLIFDEADKLNDNVLAYLISLYNKLEGYAGIVLLSTAYIERRIATGLRYNKRGYNELHSRMGRRFYAISAATPNDIYAVCLANGVADDKAIRKVIADAEEYENDLRRVRRSVRRERQLAS